MHADNRAIDKHILKVRITRQSLKYTVKHPVLGPAAKPPEDTIPTAEARGQIAPRRTNPHTPQNRLQKSRLSFAVTPQSLALPGNKGSGHL